MQLDPQSIIIIAIQIVAFTLLLIGVYPAKQREENKNLIKHGLFSTLAFGVNVATVFAVMIPVFLKIVNGTSISSLIQFPFIWTHAIIGATTLISSIIMITSWIFAPITELGCAKRWRLMKPTLAIWAASIALGAIMHIYALL
jgi:hypothetical protein